MSGCVEQGEVVRNEQIGSDVMDYGYPRTNTSSRSKR